MANWLTNVLNKHLNEKESIMDLCCGIGNVSDGLLYSKIIGVDACDSYLNIYRKKVKNSEVICFDLSKIAEEEGLLFKDASVDNVLCIDGVEHLELEQSIDLIDRLEKIALKKIIIFTPEHASDPNRLVINHPKNTWGIPDTDQWQIHRSAFPRTFWLNRGYNCYELNKAKNVYDGTFYYEMMYIKEKK